MTNNTTFLPNSHLCHFVNFIKVSTKSNGKSAWYLFTVCWPLINGLYCKCPIHWVSLLSIHNTLEKENW